MIKNIILIGFMGSGKTTVGRVLAKKLGYGFIDTDDLVEANEGMDIPQIFQMKGEAYFRQLESTALSQGVRQKECVIATGGGVVTIEDNNKILKEGIVIYLKATADQIYSNVKHNRSRPLLQNDDVYGTISTMLKQRQDLYEQAAHYTIQVDGKTPQEITNLIVRVIK